MAISRANLPKQMEGKMKNRKKAGKCSAKGYKEGGSLKMVEKNGKKVPFYAADGEGKMMAGGKVKKAYKSGGKVRGCGMAKKGTRKAKMY